MAVPTLMTDLSTTEASNVPSGSETVSAAAGPDEYFRAHAMILRTLCASDTIAAAATTDLSTKANTFLTLTGTATTITALGTVAAGIHKWVIYNAAHTVTHNATSLILMGGASRTVAAGEASLFVSEGSGNWRELVFSDATGYQPLDTLLTALAAQTTAANNIQAYSGADTPTLLSTGTAAGNVPLVGTSSATDALAGLVELATSAETITGTDTARATHSAGVKAAIDAKVPAPSTSGNVMTSDGAAWTSAAPVLGGMTLLGTLTTTSGTTQTLSGLTLTGYKFLMCSVEGVSINNTVALELNVQNIASALISAADVYRGLVWIELTSGFATAIIHSSGTATGTVYAIDTLYSTASTSIVFGANSNTFDAGLIRVWGVK